MTKLLRYKDYNTGNIYYGLSDNPFFENKKMVAVVKENATRKDLEKIAFQGKQLRSI